LRTALRAWLAWFHVAPRLELPDAAAALAVKQGLTCRTIRGLFGYYQLITITRPLA
jgi:S-adenosylmethionine-diacylgycerolhomoserine-N-methlytransferase